MQKFTVKIDLSTFFDDERKLVLILVDPDWENVECLQRRVENIFEVEAVRFLTNEGCFIPPQEPIEMIKFFDILKAFIPMESLQKKRKKSKHKHTVPTLSIEHSNSEEKGEQKKRKHFSLESCFASSTPNQAKRSKNVHATLDNDFKSSNKSNEITSSTNEKLIEQKKSKKSKVNVSIESEKIKNKSKHVEMEVVTNNQDNSLCKHKRLHKKKKSLNETNKENVENISQELLNTETVTDHKILKNRPSSVPSSTFLNQSARLINQKTQKQRTSKTNPNDTGHIYYNESGEMVSTTTQNETVIESTIDSKEKCAAAKVIFRCNLNEAELTKPRIFQLKPLNKRSSGQKSTIIIQEQIILNPLSVPNKTIETEISEEVILQKTNELLHQSEIHNESSVIAVDYDEEENETIGEDSEIIDLNDSEDFSRRMSTIECKANAPAAESCTKDFQDEISVDKILPFSITLHNLPEINDIVIFKLFRLDIKSAPGITNYIAGKCEYTNKRTKNIKLIVVDGQSEVDSLPSKFVCNLDDSGGQKYLNIKLTEMIDPRIFKMS